MPLVKRSDDQEHSIATSLQRYAETAAPVLEHYKSGRFHALDASVTPGSLLEIVEDLVKSAESARAAMA